MSTHPVDRATVGAKGYPTMNEAYVRIRCKIVLIQYQLEKCTETSMERVYIAVIPGHWAQDPAQVEHVAQIVGNFLAKQTADHVARVMANESWDGSATQDVPVEWALIPTGSDGDCTDGGRVLRISEDGTCE
jgi:hypothetical protein